MTEECCFECHLTPLPPQWPLVHPGQHSLSHIFTAKQEWLPLLLCLNLISSLLLSNSPITLLLSSPFFLPAIQNLKRKKRLSTSKKHRDEWLFRAWLLGGEKRAAVFAKCGVGDSVWILDRCIWEVQWGHTSNLYMDRKAKQSLMSFKKQRERQPTTKRETEFTSRLLFKLLTSLTRCNKVFIYFPLYKFSAL